MRREIEVAEPYMKFVFMKTKLPPALGFQLPRRTLKHVESL